MKVVPVGGEVNTNELFGCHMEESASIVKFINFVSMTRQIIGPFSTPAAHASPPLSTFNMDLPLSQMSFVALIFPFFFFFFTSL